MFAVYAVKGNIENPLASLVVGERPDPTVPEGWVRVNVSHASLNRHDVFTLRGITGQATPIVFPMILGNDGAGTLDDGTDVVIYPVMGSVDWKDDETLDPEWHIFSERVQGTFADCVAVPRRNAIPLPQGISPLHASRTFDSGEKLPHRVEAVIDNIGQATWPHTLQSVRRGGTVVTAGITTGNDPSASLLNMIVEQITVAGTIMGTLEEMNNLMKFVISSGIKPEIGQVLPLERAEEAIRAMVGGQTHGKTVFTR